MVQLIYVSYSSQDFSLEELPDILRKSVENNKKDDITGMLLYAGECFIQVLEGPLEKVEQRYEIIKKDPRHEDCRIVDKRMIERRAFPTWSMSFNDLNTINKDELEGFSDFLSQNPTSEALLRAPNEVYQLLVRFKERNSNID